MRVANPLMRTAITSPLGRRIPFALLSFAGRRSGKAYSVPVGVYEVDGVATVFTDGTWRFNFRDERSVTVILRGERRTGHATLVEDRAPARVAGIAPPGHRGCGGQARAS